MGLLKDLYDLVASNHPGLPDDAGFALLANIAGASVDMPYVFADGLEVRPAEPSEIDTLRTLLGVSVPGPLLSPTRNPYETEVQTEQTGPGSHTYTSTDLPRESWRYHVIAFNGPHAHNKLCDFVRATLLTNCRLVLGPEVGAADKASGFGRFLAGCGPAFARLWDGLSISDEAFLRPGLEELKDMADVYERLSMYGSSRTDLDGALRSLEQLDFLPAHSPLLFLGYVSVLESLVTHQPDPKDAYDSLTRQVRQKMLLIGHRSILPIPYELFDAAASPETLWTRLYDYRSQIAHGASPDFRGKLQVLRDAATALEFVSGAAVAVVRQVLEEPDLMADLRDC